jgi:hypothetical protein
MDPESRRASILRGFEDKTEFLVAHQLDLLAQIEHHLRGVQHTMRRIERLRSSRHRVGPELSNRERGVLLTGLAVELAGIDAQLVTQHESCDAMQQIIQQMQARLTELHDVAARLETEPPPANERGSLSI